MNIFSTYYYICMQYTTYIKNKIILLIFLPVLCQGVLTIYHVVHIKVVVRFFIAASGFVIIEE